MCASLGEVLKIPLSEQMEYKEFLLKLVITNDKNWNEMLLSSYVNVT